MQVLPQRLIPAHTTRIYLLHALAWLVTLVQLQAQTLQLVNRDSALCVSVSGNQPPILSLPLNQPFISFERVEERLRVKLGTVRNKVRVQQHLKELSLSPPTQDGADILLHGHAHDRSDTVWFLARFHQPAPTQLLLTIDKVRWTAPGFEVRLHYHDDSPVHFGLGEQFGAVALGRECIPMQVEENGIGRGDPSATGLARMAGAQGTRHSTYMPVPWLMDLNGRGVLAPHADLREIDLSQPGIATISYRSGQARLHIFHSTAPLDLLTQFSAVNGRLPAPPGWAYGAWLGLQGGPDKCRRIVAQAKEAGMPLSAIWIQDWVGRRKTRFGSRLDWHWQADTAAYPGIRSFIAEMNAQGIQVLGYINPFLSTESPWASSAAPHLLQDDKGQPLSVPAAGFKAHLFDLRNPAARQWLVEVIQREMIDLGFSGWMADFGEWWPGEGGDPSADPAFWNDHNTYPVLWQQVNRAAIQGHPRADELLFFSRSGALGSPHAASLFWTGDQLTSFGHHDGLPSAIRGMLSAGMSGFSLIHSDIGGYTNIKFPGVDIRRSRDLYYRWCELGAFNPIFRTHEGLRPDDNVQPWTDSLSLAFTTRMARLHESMRPYWEALGNEAEEMGWPVLRHLWLHHPHDPEVLKAEHQFLVGEDLLVLPVIQAAQDSVTGYFPAGEWVPLSGIGGAIQGPQWLRVPAAHGYPAAYYRADADRWEAVWRAANAILAEPWPTAGPEDILR